MLFTKRLVFSTDKTGVNLPTPSEKVKGNSSKVQNRRPSPENRLAKRPRFPDTLENSAENRRKTRSGMKTKIGSLPSIMALCAAMTSCPLAADSTSSARTAAPEPPERQLIYTDDFGGDLSQWVVEQMPGGTTTLQDGQLDINDAAGCTVWFKHKLEGPVMIEYDATLVQQGGEYDRVSDLNCFWMAVDPGHPDDLFANAEKRGGKFENYHALRLYYVGYGANGNTTTRFRRYPGDGSRPCLPGYDLQDQQFLHTPNKTLKIQIIADGSTIRYLRDGEPVFDFKDENPFTEGWFAFRTAQNHLRIDNFRVYRPAP
jgi:hypothetical protein